MAGGAQDPPVVAQREMFRVICEGLSNMRRFHWFARRSGPMAGLAKLRLCVLVRDEIPDAALSRGAVDSMAVDAGALGDEAELVCPLVCSWIVYGILYVQLVLVAEATEVDNGGPEQFRALGLLVDVVAGCAEYSPVIAQLQSDRQVIEVFGYRLTHMRCFHDLTRSAGSVAVLASLFQSVAIGKRCPDAVFFILAVDRVTVETRAPGCETYLACPLVCSGVMHGIPYAQLVLVAGAAEIWDQVIRCRCRCLRPEVRALSIVGCVAHSAGAYGRMQAKLFAHLRRELCGIVRRPL